MSAQTAGAGRPLRTIGMISGTSHDAIEAVLVELSRAGTRLVADLRGHMSVPYPTAVRDALLAVLPPARTTAAALCALDARVGQCFAGVAADLVHRHPGGRPDLVCSHGQTVYHWVDGGRALGTLQLGQAAWIAERTGATVVSDVRIRDIAAGGQGAPLASLLDVLLFGSHPSRVTGALNLGGIANVTVVGPVRDPVAFDIGPANALIDAAAGWLAAGAVDRDEDGRGAARGSVDAELLASLLHDPYYAAPPPKSTGKEHFHLGHVQQHLGGRRLAPDDLLATLTELTARTVADALVRHGVERLVVSGGGTRNPTLMAALSRHLPGVSLERLDSLGVDEAAKEALLMAVIGYLTVHGWAGTLPSCTGARHPTVLGAVTPGTRPLPLTGGGRPPRRLVVRTPLPAGGGC